IVEPEGAADVSPDHRLAYRQLDRVAQVFQIDPRHSATNVLREARTVALADEEVGRDSQRPDRVVRLAEEEVRVLGIDLHHVVAQAVRRVEPAVSTLAV